MELKKITEEVSALTEQFPYFWSQFELEESHSEHPHSQNYSQTFLPHNPYHGHSSIIHHTSGSHEIIPDLIDMNNPSSDDLIQHYTLPTISQLPNTLHTSIGHSKLLSQSHLHHHPPTTSNTNPNLSSNISSQVSNKSSTAPPSSNLSSTPTTNNHTSPIQLENIQLHHIRCRYIERGKHFELSWSCPSMANYTWLVEQPDIDPRCLNRIRDGTIRHGRHNPAILGPDTGANSPFRLKAEIGIETNEGWVSIQQCCSQCSGPLVLFAAASTRLSEQGHGRIVAQVHFTKTHGGRAATVKVGLRLKCIAVDPNSSSSTSSYSSSSSVSHLDPSQQNPIIISSTSLSQSGSGSSSTSQTSIEQAQYEIVSNWTDLPFKRHENKKRKNPFDDTSHRRSEPRRRVTTQSEEPKRGRPLGSTSQKIKEEKQNQSHSYRECNNLSILSNYDAALQPQFNHYGSNFISALPPSQKVKKEKKNLSTLTNDFF